MTIGSVLSIVTQTALGYLCDKFKSIKKFVLICYAIMVIAVWFFYTKTSSMFLLTLLMGAVWYSMFKNIQGLLDSWALELDESCKKNYGVIRAGGAIGWIIGSALVSWVVGKWDYTGIGYWFAGFAVINAIMSLFIPDAVKPKDSNGQKMKVSDIGKLFANKGYILMIALLFLTFSSFGGDVFSYSQKMNALGLDTAAKYTSMKSSVQAVAELPLFFIGGLLISKFSAKKLLSFALVAQTVKLLLTFFATNQMQLVYISAMQGLTFPCILVSAKFLIDSEIPAGLKSTGQQLAIALYSSVSSLIMPTIWGLLTDSLGLSAVLLILAGFSIVTFLALLFVKTKKDVNEAQ